jgi:8-oxo-dGTP diphosphatase
MTERPYVGVGVVVLRRGRVLLGRRLGAHGAGAWQFPGGHLEAWEPVADCARREVREETGLEIGDVRRGPYTEDLFPGEGKHYVTLFVTARSEEGAPEAREPDRATEWRWFDWDALPEPLFTPLVNLRASGWRPPAGEASSFEEGSSSEAGSSSDQEER